MSAIVKATPGLAAPVTLVPVDLHMMDLEDLHMLALAGHVTQGRVDLNIMVPEDLHMMDQEGLDTAGLVVLPTMDLAAPVTLVPVDLHMMDLVDLVILDQVAQGKIAQLFANKTSLTNEQTTNRCYLSFD